MDKLRLVKSISFGERVAEDEINELAKYFVETDQWSRMVKGEIDIVSGAKGAGKSAIYSLLITQESEFFDRNTLLVPGEKPRGAPVFKDIIANPPTAELEFVGLWKLYILALVGRKMRDWDIKGAAAEKVYSTLTSARLLDREYDLSSLLQAAQDLARRLFKSESVEGGLTIDPATGLPNGITGKITLREPAAALRDLGFLTADRLIAYANTALEDAGMQIWLLLDRLDVAFAETHELERNALRALFRVYRDLAEHDAIKLKIFLRSDIWSRINEGGFREASHITKFVVLDWSQASLLNLVIRRLISNPALEQALSIDRERILSDFNAQRDLFYRVFPPQVDQGSKKPPTLDWMISRCADGARKTAPRELIHLLTSLREKEISRLERGEPQAPGEQLFDRSVFKEALSIVSETRYHQNLIAEYPNLKDILTKLNGEKTEQTADSLAELWEMNRDQAEAQAFKLVEIGFFELRGPKDAQTFWVPFLFRDALSMSQG
ncbi:MAG: P-loop ATPase, Sll1717 family, partial [Methylocella sp.]